MTRPLRFKAKDIEGGAIYHLVTRCALQRRLFRKSEDKEVVIAILRKVAEFSGIEILNFCVMSNHIHIIVCVPDARDVSEKEILRRYAVLYGKQATETLAAIWSRLAEPARENARNALRRRMGDISPFMQNLKQRISIAYHARHPKTGGTLWQGRFYSALVESGEALRAVAAYVDLNPVRAHMVANASDYPHSARGASARGDRSAMAMVAALTRRVGDYSDLLLGKTPHLKPDAPLPRDLPLADALQLRRKSITSSPVIGSPEFIGTHYLPFLQSCGRRRPLPPPTPLHPALPFCIPGNVRAPA